MFDFSLFKHLLWSFLFYLRLYRLFLLLSTLRLCLGLSLIDSRSRLDFFLFGLACLEKLFFLLSPQFAILPHFQIFFDGFGPLIVKVTLELLLILSKNLRVLKFPLNALTLDFLKLLFEFLFACAQLYLTHRLNIVHAVHSQHIEGILISLQVHHILKFRLKIVFQGTNSKHFKLLVEDKLDQ